MRKIVPFNNVLTFNTDVYEITAISLEHNLEKEDDELSGVFYISGEYKILNGGINPEKFNFELPFDIALGMRYDMNSMLVDIDDFRYELIDGNKMKVNIDLYIDGEELPEEEVEELVSEPTVSKVCEVKQETLDREEVQEEQETFDDEVTESDNEVTECEETETLEDVLKKEFTTEKGEEMDSQSQEIMDVKDTMMPDIKRESDLVKEFIYNDEEEHEENIINSNNNINIDNHNENNNILNNLNDEENYVTYKVYRIVDGDTIDSILTKYKVSKEELLSYNENINDLKVGDKLIIPFK